MTKILLELRKRNTDGTLQMRTVDISELNDILLPVEIFSIELKINEIPSLRAHISVREE